MAFLPTPWEATRVGSRTLARLLAAMSSSPSSPTRSARSLTFMTCKQSPLFLLRPPCSTLTDPPYQARLPGHHQRRREGHCLHHPLCLHHRPEQEDPSHPLLPGLDWPQLRRGPPCPRLAPDRRQVQGHHPDRLGPRRRRHRRPQRQERPGQGAARERAGHRQGPTHRVGK